MMWDNSPFYLTTVWQHPPWNTCLRFASMQFAQIIQVTKVAETTKDLQSCYQGVWAIGCRIKMLAQAPTVTDFSFGKGGGVLSVFSCTYLKALYVKYWLFTIFKRTILQFCCLWVIKDISLGRVRFFVRWIHGDTVARSCSGRRLGWREWAGSLIGCAALRVLQSAAGGPHVTVKRACVCVCARRDAPLLLRASLWMMLLWMIGWVTWKHSRGGNHINYWGKAF